MNTRPYITVRDFSVSNEYFNLVQEKDTELLKTLPQPSLEKLPEYYKSEDYISHTDSQRNLFEKIYQKVRSYALYKKVNLISMGKNGMIQKLMEMKSQ